MSMSSTRDAAHLGHDKADDHVKAGCFTRAVRTEQADHFSAGNAEADVANDLATTVRFADSLGAECLHSHPRVEVARSPLLGRLRFGDCLAAIALDSDAIIAAMENQRTAGNGAMGLIGNTRRGGSGAGQRE